MLATLQIYCDRYRQLGKWSVLQVPMALHALDGVACFRVKFNSRPKIGRELLEDTLIVRRNALVRGQSTCEGLNGLLRF